MGVGRMAVDDAHRIPEKDDIVPPEHASRCLGFDGLATAVAGLVPLTRS
jgi:hypothetical protein